MGCRSDSYGQTMHCIYCDIIAMILHFAITFRKCATFMLWPFQSDSGKFNLIFWLNFTCIRSKNNANTVIIHTCHYLQFRLWMMHVTFMLYMSHQHEAGYDHFKATLENAIFVLCPQLYYLVLLIF